MLGAFRDRQGRSEGGSDIRCSDQGGNHFETVRSRGIREDRLESNCRGRDESGDGMLNGIIHGKRNDRHATYRWRLFTGLRGFGRLHQVIIGIRRIADFFNYLHATIRYRARVDLYGNKDIIYAIARRDRRLANLLFFFSVFRLIFQLNFDGRVVCSDFLYGVFNYREIIANRRRDFRARPTGAFGAFLGTQFSGVLRLGCPDGFLVSACRRQDSAITNGCDGRLFGLFQRLISNVFRGLTGDIRYTFACLDAVLRVRAQAFYFNYGLGRVDANDVRVARAVAIFASRFGSELALQDLIEG